MVQKFHNFCSYFFSCSLGMYKIQDNLFSFFRTIKIVSNFSYLLFVANLAVLCLLKYLPLLVSFTPSAFLSFLSGTISLQPKKLLQLAFLHWSAGDKASQPLSFVNVSTFLKFVKAIFMGYRFNALFLHHFKGISPFLMSCLLGENSAVSHIFSLYAICFIFQPTTKRLVFLLFKSVIIECLVLIFKNYPM